METSGPIIVVAWKIEQSIKNSGSIIENYYLIFTNNLIL
jgi:hypothetical protein